MGTHTIAVGKQKEDKRWVNTPITWEALCKRLTTTTRTYETVGEYRIFTKARRDTIKDVGGFVGGYIAGGRRLKSSVLNRSIVALDADFATADNWLGKLKESIDFAACIYTTHSHVPHAPKFRVIIPLDREAAPEEYEAVARKLAYRIGIDMFDDTTFEVHRLMFWPSTPKDGQFVGEVVAGAPVGVDSVLAAYTDWKDSSQWPLSARVAQRVQQGTGKMGDPTTKFGPVGLFCRAYTIATAIDAHLKHIYTPHSPARYTYAQGSTAGGLVVYDDMFAYSHHGTDPVGQQLANAFDLVRMHLHGGLDDADTDLPISKRPSYAAMVATVAADARCRGLNIDERTARAVSDFGLDEEGGQSDAAPSDAAVAAEAAHEAALANLDSDKKGNIRPTARNIINILEHDKQLRGRILYDAFTHIVSISRPFFWARDTDTKCPRPITDIDIVYIRTYLESTYDITGREKVADAITAVAHSNSHHPVRQFLKGCSWDGTPRLDTTFIDYLGAEDTVYTRAVSRKALLACVARVFEPGIKFDHVLTFVSIEGAGKSTMLDKLGRTWFTDSLPSIGKDTQKAYEAIQGSWLIEVAELEGFAGGSTNEAVKHFISKRADKFRPAYGHFPINAPRQCVFFGTTNRFDFLRDPTGNRRFWPIALKGNPKYDVHNEFTEDVVEQVWGEAMAAYAAGEGLWIGKEIEQVAATYQAQHLQGDDRAGHLSQWLDAPVPADFDTYNLAQRQHFRSFITSDSGAPLTAWRNEVTPYEVWVEHFHRDPADFTKARARELNGILEAVPGWERAPSVRSAEPYIGKRSRGFKRTTQRVSVQPTAVVKSTAREVEELDIWVTQSKGKTK